MLNEEDGLEEAQRLLDSANQPNFLQYYFQKLEYGFGSASASGSPTQEERLTLEPDDPSKTDTESP